jgi:hypothetical protein
MLISMFKELYEVPDHVLWDLRWTKWHRGRFSPRTSVSLSILIPQIAPHSLSILSSTLYVVSILTESENNKCKEN